MTTDLHWSVAMCTYNGERFLQEQLESIKNQTLPPAELVIVDDASRDGTRNILAAFAHDVPFDVRVITLEQNVGSIRAFQRAISETRFELVALCDQDDVWYPEKLQVLDECFDRHPRAGLVFSDADMIDEEGRRVGHTAWESGQVRFVDERRSTFEPDDAFMTLFWDCYVTGAAAAFKASHKALILPFDELISGNHQAWKIHDGWAAMLIAAVAEVIPVDRPLLGYRRHSGQQVGLTTEMAPVAPGHRPRQALQLANFEVRLKRLTLVRDRLADVTPTEAVAALRRLDDEIEHLQTRKALPRNPAARARRVLAEHRRGGYRRYSQGLLGVGRDLAGV